MHNGLADATATQSSLDSLKSKWFNLSDTGLTRCLCLSALFLACLFEMTAGKTSFLKGDSLSDIAAAQHHTFSRCLP